MNIPPSQSESPFDYVAIDVSKATLQVQDSRTCFSEDNVPQGYRRLLSFLRKLDNPLVVFEASGGYERALLHHLHKAAMPLNMVNPARVRDFARSEGIRAKTDPIDAKMILAFAKSKALRPMASPSENSSKLAALLDRRAHLVEQLAREKNRLQTSEPFIHGSIKRMVNVLEKEIASLDKAIAQLVDSDPGLSCRSQIMQSIKGVGKVTAWTLLAYLTELETLNRNKLVALAGLAPFNRDSGKSSAKRSIQGGTAKVRSCLYMAAHTAASCNPVIAPYVQRLRLRGKPYKCAIVAAMRKLLIHIQSKIKSAQLSPC